MQQYGFNLFDKKGWREVVVDAPDEETAIDRAMNKIGIAPIVVELPWEVCKDNLHEVEPITHKGWLYYPEEIVLRETPEFLHQNILSLINGYKKSEDAFFYRTEVKFTAIPLNIFNPNFKKYARKIKRGTIGSKRVR